jgi:hypothetical protein
VVPADQIPKLAPRAPARDRRDIEITFPPLADARPMRPDAAAHGFRPLAEIAAAVFEEMNRARRIREVGTATKAPQGSTRARSVTWS